MAKLHEKVANQRKNFLHHQSKELAYTYDVVVVETLNMKGLSRALKFGKSVVDNGWGMFTTFLKYKLDTQGKRFIPIDKWFSSTKTCSACGNIKEMALSERVYVSECGLNLDRDLNSAINIEKEGWRILLSEK